MVECSHDNVFEHNGSDGGDFTKSKGDAFVEEDNVAINMELSPILLTLIEVIVQKYFLVFFISIESSFISSLRGFYP